MATVDTLSIGERIRQLRNGLMTQDDLAAAAGVSTDLVRKLEQGRRHTASIASLHRIARALDVDLGELLGREATAQSAPDAGVIALRQAVATAGRASPSAPGGYLAGSVIVTASRPSRRRILAGALVLGAPVLPGCTARDTGPPAPDPLGPVAHRAEADVRLADAVAAAHPTLAGAAAALASDRREHAAAVHAELRRARPSPPTASSAPPRSPAPVVAPPEPAAARATLVDALRVAQDQAAALVAAAPGHRAALLASVAACCASHLAVLP